MRNPDDIDFSKIRSLSKGQTAGFEELTCQIFRLESMPAGSEFRRIEGSGGDGGVEAYWLRPDGTKHGIQAKFHLKARDIDWGKIDNSVRTALEIHPTLTRYVVTLACDLSDRSGDKGRGKSGWELWENHKAKWEDWGRQVGQIVTFELWSASVLRQHLVAPSRAGLVRY